MPDLSAMLAKQVGSVAIVIAFVYGAVRLFEINTTPSNLAGVGMLLATFVFAVVVICFEIAGRHYQALVSSYEKAVDALSRSIKQNAKTQTASKTATEPSATEAPEAATKKIGGYTIEDRTGGNTAAE